MQTLGLDKRAGTVSPELKAPMPGLVLNVLVKSGDAVVAQVHAVQGKAVDKGQLLLMFAKN